MRIVFDESTLEQGDNKSRSITGVLYFDFGEVFFPDKNWSDFVVVIAAWWLHALERLERGAESEVDIRFMDGPYRIVLMRKNERAVLIRCVEERQSANIVHEENVGLSEFSAQVRQVARQIASACGRVGIASSDLEALGKYLLN